jgi:3-methyladenine DNA glycosylase/8-oxoguanine DNA glycosylase
MAERADRGELDFSRLHELTDDEVITHLTQVKGVGEWTAHMFLMFTLKRPDILPTGDFGVRMAMMKLYKKRKMPNPKQMEKLARSWQPYRSVACWYLWRSLDIKPT